MACLPPPRPVVQAFLEACPEGVAAIGAHAGDLQKLIKDLITSNRGSLTTCMRGLQDLCSNDKGVAVKCLQLNAALKQLSGHQASQPPIVPTALKAWRAMDAASRALHQTVFWGVAQLQLHTIKSLPQARQKAAKALAKAAVARGEAAAAVLEQPAADEMTVNQEAVGRIAGWAVKKIVAATAGMDNLHVVAQSMLDKDAQPPAQEQTVQPGGACFQVATVTVAKDCVVQYFCLLQQQLGNIATAASLLSLRGEAYRSWEAGLEASRSLWDAWLAMCKQLDLETTATEEDTQPVLRQLQGMFAQQYLHAIVLELLRSFQSVKAGQDQPKLALRDSLKVKSANRPGAGGDEL